MSANTNYDGLTRNQWPGTWSPTGSHPIVLDREIRGGLRFITGEVGDRLTDIAGQRLENGMLTFLQNGYTANGVTFASNRYYQYRILEGESRNPSTGALVNAEQNWQILDTVEGNIQGSLNVSQGLTVSGNINVNSNLALLNTSAISIGGNIGSSGQVLTSNGATTIWASKYYYGDTPPDFDKLNYGDIFFYIDTPNNFSRMYMWVTDGSSEFFYDFLPPTF